MPDRHTFATGLRADGKTDGPGYGGKAHRQDRATREKSCKTNERMGEVRARGAWTGRAGRWGGSAWGADWLASYTIS